MNLRKLERKDAPLMIEWMHDDSVVHDLKTDFLNKTIEDCYSFIEISNDATASIHMAIVDDNDEYMGTVSLKDIVDGTAEFAITIRACAMGKGYSKYAMERIIDIGINELKLKSIYWCVSPDNKRAVRFYDKNGYDRVDPDDLKIAGGYAQEEINSYIWYNVSSASA